MIKTKFAIIIDTTIISSIIFVISSIWIYRYTKTAILTFILSIIVYLLSYFIIYLKQIKKYNLSKLKNNDLNFKKYCYDNIINYTNKKLNDFYIELLNATKIKSNIYKNQNSIFYINLQKTLTSDDFFKINNFVLEKNILSPISILSRNCDNDFLELLSKSNINYNLYNENEIFILIKNKKLINEKQSQNKTINLNNIKLLFKQNLKRKKFKEFFFSGLSLISLSFFISNGIIYLILGSTLLILSIFCIKSNEPKFKEKPKLSDLIKKDVKT